MKRDLLRHIITILILLLPYTQTLATTYANKMYSQRIQRWQTANGTSVVFYPAMEVPMLNISIAFAAGSAYDGKNFGISALTANLLNQGNGGLDATAVAEKLANVGAQFMMDNTQNMVVLNLRTLSKENALASAIDAFTLIITQPDFPIDAFQRAKNQQLTAINQAQESPEQIADLLFFNKLYGKHPYAHPILGTKDTVSAITLKEIREFYQRYFVASNAVIVMVGAITKEQAQQLATQLTQHLAIGHPAALIPPAAQLTSNISAMVDFPASQTVLRLGQIGIDYHATDYFPLLVGNYILGGGALVSQLNTAIREQRGLTYSIVSQFIPLPGGGPFIIALATVKKQAKTALEITKEILNKFISTGPNDTELIAAKKYLIGSFPLSLASNAGIAKALLYMSFFNLPNDYLDTYSANINAVSQEDIKRAFNKTINSRNLLLVSVGKA